MPGSDSGSGRFEGGVQAAKQEANPIVPVILMVRQQLSRRLFVALKFMWVALKFMVSPGGCSYSVLHRQRHQPRCLLVVGSARKISINSHI